MTTSSTIPVSITPEARARIGELGLQAQADRMINYARQNLPDLVRIEVELNDRHDLGGDPGVAIAAWSQRPFEPAENVSADLGWWAITNFPPEVLEHLHLSYLPGAGHVG